MKISTSQIEISGLNLERKLNMLTKRGIKLYSVERISKRKCVILVSSANTKQIIDLLSEKCYNDDGTIAVIKPKVAPKGLAFFREFAKRHIAFALAVVLILPLLWLSSLFCLRIDITSTIDESEVLLTLDEFGVSLFKPLTNIDVKKLQNHLCTNLDVSYAEVEIRGSVLYIELIDRVNFDDYIDLNAPYNIVATHDGTVSKMTVVQGTPLVSVGEKVKKGQVLIEGKRTFNDGSTVDTRAIGEVFAFVSVSATATFSPTIVVYNKTGQSINRTVVNIGKVSTSIREIDFEHFEIEQTSIVLYPLNIEVVYQTIFELAPTVIELTFPQALAELKTQALNLAIKKLFFVPTTTEYDIFEEKSVTVTLHGEIKINSEKL